MEFCAERIPARRGCERSGARHRTRAAADDGSREGRCRTLRDVLGRSHHRRSPRLDDVRPGSKAALIDTRPCGSVAGGNEPCVSRHAHLADERCAGSRILGGRDLLRSGQLDPRNDRVRSPLRRPFSLPEPAPRLLLSPSEVASNRLETQPPIGPPGTWHRSRRLLVAWPERLAVRLAACVRLRQPPPSLSRCRTIRQYGGC